MESCDGTSRDEKEFIPQVLKAVHLPCLPKDDLDEIQKKVHHIPEAKALVKEAKEKHGPIHFVSASHPVDVWCVPRFQYDPRYQYLTFSVDELKNSTAKHSDIIFFHGVPICFSGRAQHPEGSARAVPGQSEMEIKFQEELIHRKWNIISLSAA